MEYKLNFGKSLKNDFILFLGFIFFAISVGLLIIGPFCINGKFKIDYKMMMESVFPECTHTSDFIGLIVASVFLIAGLVISIVRIKYIKSYGNEYKHVDAVITDINQYRDRFGIDVVFTYKNQEFHKHFSLMLNKETKELVNKDTVSLLIRNDAAQHVLISDLYFY